jgi:hypothetical protein
MKVSGMKCLMCGETIFSKYRHDFVTCFCGNVFVDGGQTGVTRAGALFPNKIKSVIAEVKEKDLLQLRDINKFPERLTRDKSFTDKQREEARAHILLLK